MAGETGDRSLEETPTWAVAVVCAVFVIISVLIEHGIHSLGKWFQKRQKKAMSEALEKIKAELMLLGFISLLLTFGTKYIAQICIPPKVGGSMLPCKKKHKSEDEETGNEGHKRKLMSLAEDVIWRRALAEASGDDHCTKHGKVPLISQTGVHQLHIFIFVLTIFHVLYSVITMVLGQAKMNKWKKWESETTSFEYQFTNDPERFRFASQTSFVKRHTGWSTTPGIRWIVAFFRQFFGSTTKVDYLTMRHGFINAHLTPNSKFDFHKYIKRSMEDDFKVVVGISNSLWCFAVIFLLLNVYNWYTLSWLAFLPLVILLMLGMKLEIVIMEMAQQIQERTTVVKGVPVVEPNNNLFWFSQPRWILFLIHFTLFQNAFQMAYFLWIWYEFGLKSCFHEDLTAIIIRVVFGLALQILCSYITFPLYALVTQMGSHMKHAIFEEQTAKALMKWRKAAKEKKKLRKAGVMDASISGENTPSIGSSPIHLLHKYKSHQIDIDILANFPRSYQSETDLSDAEPPTPMSPDDHEPTRHQVVSHDGHEPQRHGYSGKDGEIHSEDFSFSKP